MPQLSLFRARAATPPLRAPPAVAAAHSPSSKSAHRSACVPRPFAPIHEAEDVRDCALGHVGVRDPYWRQAEIAGPPRRCAAISQSHMARRPAPDETVIRIDVPSTPQRRAESATNLYSRETRPPLSHLARRTDASKQIYVCISAGRSMVVEKRRAGTTRTRVRSRCEEVRVWSLPVGARCAL